MGRSRSKATRQSSNSHGEFSQSRERRAREPGGEQHVAGEAPGNTEAGGGGRPAGGQVRLQVLLSAVLQHLRQVRHLVPRGALPARQFDYIKFFTACTR